MPIASIITLALVIATVLVAAPFVVNVLALAVLLSVGAITLLFVLDAVVGGTALEQLANKISIWLKTRIGD